MSWPNEHRPTSTAQRIEEARARIELRRNAIPNSWFSTPPAYDKPYPEDEALRREVVERFDDDAPRHAYAAWMQAQPDDNARWIGDFIEAQLEVADAYRENPRRSLLEILGERTYGGYNGFRTWPADHRYDLDLLMSEGLVGQPQFFRGFVEAVTMRAHRFLELAEEVFSLAPIRHLALIDVPDAVEALAASPHLARMRSLVLATHGNDQDALTDDMLARLLDSPYLGNIAHLRLGGPHRLTPRAYEAVVTAPSLPMLSSFEVYIDGTSTIWAEAVKPSYDEAQLTYFQRVMEKYPLSQDLRETPTPVRLRPEDWIVELERKLGYVPCVHPEEHYGRYLVDIEAVTSHPIALDAEVMARRGQPVPDPGPKPSLMARRARGLCAICGSPDFAYEAPPIDPYSDPLGLAGIYVCQRCGTRWYAEQWPEKQR